MVMKYTLRGGGVYGLARVGFTMASSYYHMIDLTVVNNQGEIASEACNLIVISSYAAMNLQ